MAFRDCSLDEFCESLASATPTPGGGGASALAGSVGVCLATMVGNLTVGKKKYAAVEDEVLSIMCDAKAVQEELLALIDADAQAFEPLSRAYAIPKADPKRPGVMEHALRVASRPPIDIMRTVTKAIDIHARMARIGSRIALSDVGVGVVICKAALKGASLNVYVNTKYMADTEYAAQLESEADRLVEAYSRIADDVYDYVVEQLRT